MILTQCPVCAAPLPPTSAKQCSRCKTRYCGPACQKKHWEEGGHDKLCKKIRKGGGAEQFHANTKYAEAVAVAAEACAEDTKGQTCYICTEAVHRRTKEGLVRGCACRGTAGVAHVSCLAEQVRILCDEAAENHLDMSPRWVRWHTCSLCEQSYHGVVFCAMGWACWKTYAGRSENNKARMSAMTVLGSALCAEDQEGALRVREAELAMLRYHDSPEEYLLIAQGNLANSYQRLGRAEAALNMYRDVYSGRLRIFGEEHRDTLMAANNYANFLIELQHYAEAKSLLRKLAPAAQRVLGESEQLKFVLRMIYARALYMAPRASADDLREAAKILTETARAARRVLGGAHPRALAIEESLRESRAALSACEASAA